MAIDDNTVYGLTGAQVKELPGKIEAVKGLAKVLTVDNYNWPLTGTKTSVALWLLDAGLYTWGLNIRVQSDTSTNLSNSRLALVSSAAPGAYRHIFVTGDSSYNSQRWYGQFYITDNQGARVRSYPIYNPVDSLTSTDTLMSLSANQGRVLKSLIDAIAVPTEFTTAEWNALWA